MQHSRRRFLKTSGVIAGTGLLGASAGCTGILGGGSGGGGAFGGNADWFYELGTISDGDHYLVDYQANVEIATHENAFDSEFYDDLEGTFESSYEVLDLDFDEVESVTTFSGFHCRVLSGYQVAREDVVDALEDDDFEDDEYEGFQVFLGPEERQAVGLTNDDILVAGTDWINDEAAIDVLETAVDTYNGEEARYVDENDDFAAVTSQLDSGTFVSAWMHEEFEETNAENGQFEGEVARGSSESVNGETTSVQAVIAFDSADDIDMGDVEDFRDDSSAFDDVRLNSSGRSVVISGTVDTTDY